MNCFLIRNLLDLHCAGRLAGRQSRWIEAHLAVCPACAKETASWRRLFGGLRAIAPVRAPNGLKEALKAAVREAAEHVSPASPAPVPAFRVDAIAAMFADHTNALTFAFSLAVFLVSMSASMFGPGAPSQTCSDSGESVCSLPGGAK